MPSLARFRKVALCGAQAVVYIVPRRAALPSGTSERTASLFGSAQAGGSSSRTDLQRVLRGTWQQRRGGARARRAVRRPRRPSKLQGRYARRTAGPGHPNEPAAHWASHITA